MPYGQLAAGIRNDDDVIRLARRLRPRARESAGRSFFALGTLDGQEITGEKHLLLWSGRQLFIRAHNETLSVVAMRVSNEDCSTVGIHG